MKKFYSLTLISILATLLVSCGDSNPAIEKIVVSSSAHGVVLDATDAETLEELQRIFYNKEETPNAAPDFKFFVDITIEGQSTRWQYSIDGFIREHNVSISGDSVTKIYGLKEVAKFNRIANVRE